MTDAPNPVLEQPVGLQRLYDSENFLVVWLEYSRPLGLTADRFGPFYAEIRKEPGFEIVDKRTKREVFLTEAWADVFRDQIKRWQADTPGQDEVEQALDAIVNAISTLPLVLH